MTRDSEYLSLIEKHLQDNNYLISVDSFLDSNLADYDPDILIKIISGEVEIDKNSKLKMDLQLFEAFFINTILVPMFVSNTKH